MQLEQKTKTHKIFKRNDGRYAVTTLKGVAVNGEDKIAVLLEAGLVTAPAPKAEPEPEVEETAEAAAEEPEAPAEEPEAPAEEPEAAAEESEEKDS